MESEAMRMTPRIFVVEKKMVVTQEGIAKDDQIFVSPNVLFPPSPAQLRHLDDQYSDPPLAVDGNTLRFSNNRHPFLGFFIPHLDYHCHLLRSLHHSYKSLPVVCSRGNWRLNPETVQQWQELENNLRALKAFLLDKIGLYLPVDFVAFPLPYTCGYAQVRMSEASMRMTALRSRDAFGGLIATCSWLLAMTGSFLDREPPWLDDLCRRVPEASQWLNELFRSPVATFSTNVGRIGVVVRPDCQFLEYIPKFVEANVPVWLLWNNSVDYAGSKCARYKPSIEDYHKAVRTKFQDLGLEGHLKWAGRFPCATPAEQLVPAPARQVKIGPCAHVLPTPRIHAHH